MQSIATDGVVWSVCRLVCHDRQPAKTSELRCRLGFLGLEWAQGTMGCRCGNFEGEGRPIAKHRHAVPSAVQKRLIRSRCHFGVLSRVGPGNHILHVCTLAPPDQYYWTLHVMRWCGLMSNYFTFCFCYMLESVRAGCCHRCYMYSLFAWILLINSLYRYDY